MSKPEGSRPGETRPSPSDPMGLGRTDPLRHEEVDEPVSEGDLRLLTVGHSTMGRDEFAELLAGADVELVVDVRSAAEWAHGHLPGALHIPVGYLAERVDEIPRDRPVVVQCQGGSRSAIAASILLRLGVPEVINLRGGYDDWRREALPITLD